MSFIVYNVCDNVCMQCHEFHMRSSHWKYKACEAYCSCQHGLEEYPVFVRFWCFQRSFYARLIKVTVCMVIGTCFTLTFYRFVAVWGRSHLQTIMEYCLRYEWLKLVQGQIYRLCACCQKPKNRDSSSTAEEREPIISQEATTPSKVIQRRATSHSMIGVTKDDTVKFWVPEIQSVQPGKVHVWCVLHWFTCRPSSWIATF